MGRTLPPGSLLLEGGPAEACWFMLPHWLPLLLLPSNSDYRVPIQSLSCGHPGALPPCCSNQNSGTSAWTSLHCGDTWDMQVGLSHLMIPPSPLLEITWDPTL